MNLAAGAPGWALVVLLVILVVASIQDAIQLKIANLLSIAVLLLGVLVMVLAGPSAELWQNLVVFAVTLVIGTFLFARGKLGGGDVKMLAATSLWFDFPGALRFVLSVAIAGGLLAILVLILRQFNWSESARQKAVILRRKGGIPYGVAIAAGAAFAILLSKPEPQQAPLDNWDLATQPSGKTP